jgi:hypothetical protein
MNITTPAEEGEDIGEDQAVAAERRTDPFRKARHGEGGEEDHRPLREVEDT